MTGEEWLERVFERGLRIAEPGMYQELLGGLSALAACGALSPAAAASARNRLDATFQRLAPRPLDVRRAGTAAAPARERLEAVLAPARALADVDGFTLLLVSVELWTNGPVLRLAGLRNASTDTLDAAHEAAMARWAAARARDVGADPPELPGERLMRLPLALADDAGTTYAPGSRSGGGTGSEWRAEWRFAPAVPAAATRLTVTLDAGDERHALDLRVAR
jgi:hypothetical protein